MQAQSEQACQSGEVRGSWQVAAGRGPALCLSRFLPPAQCAAILVHVV